MFLEMMLTNLLSNAFKFTPDGGIIRVALQRGEGCFRLTVRDSGIGIPQDQQERIFERFYQVNESHAGSGIGLSIVRRIVELHQGTITLRSEPGRFSEFTITLPDNIEVYPAGKRAGEHDVRASIIRDAEKFLPEEWSGEGGDFAPDKEVPEQTRGTILLAESNAEVARYIADHFKARYGVEVAADGNDALERLKTLEPDIIIADRVLPGLDGLKLCQAVKQNIRTCHIPVVILATEGSIEEQITGIEAGADSYLPMPLSISLLAANVQNLLKARYRMRHYYSARRGDRSRQDHLQFDGRGVSEEGDPHRRGEHGQRGVLVERFQQGALHEPFEPPPEDEVHHGRVGHEIHPQDTLQPCLQTAAGP